MAIAWSPEATKAFRAYIEAEEDDQAQQQARDRVMCANLEASLLTARPGQTTAYLSVAGVAPQVPPFQGLGDSLRDMIRLEMPLSPTPFPSPSLGLEKSRSPEETPQAEPSDPYEAGSDYSTDIVDLGLQYSGNGEDGRQSDEDDFSTLREVSAGDLHLVDHPNIEDNEPWIVYAKVVNFQRPTCRPRRLIHATYCSGASSAGEAGLSSASWDHCESDDENIEAEGTEATSPSYYWSSEEGNARINNIKSYLGLPIDMNPALMLVYLLWIAPRVRKDIVIAHPGLVEAAAAIKWNGILRRVANDRSTISGRGRSQICFPGSKARCLYSETGMTWTGIRHAGRRAREAGLSGMFRLLSQAWPVLPGRAESDYLRRWREV